LREIYERSARTFTATFLDGDQAPTAPATARWKLYNLTAGVEVVPWTVISTPTSSESITIQGSQNKIRSGAKREIVELMFQSDYDDEDLIQTQVLRYLIKNVAGIDDSSGS
jgi:hypothetical protein